MDSWVRIQLSESLLNSWFRTFQAFQIRFFLCSLRMFCTETIISTRKEYGRPQAYAIFYQSCAARFFSFSKVQFSASSNLKSDLFFCFSFYPKIAFKFVNLQSNFLFFGRSLSFDSMTTIILEISKLSYFFRGPRLQDFLGLSFGITTEQTSQILSAGSELKKLFQFSIENAKLSKALYSSLIIFCEVSTSQPGQSSFLQQNISCPQYISSSTICLLQIQIEVFKKCSLNYLFSLTSIANQFPASSSTSNTNLKILPTLARELLILFQIVARMWKKSAVFISGQRMTLARMSRRRAQCRRMGSIVTRFIYLKLFPYMAEKYYIWNFWIRSQFVLLRKTLRVMTSIDTFFSWLYFLFTLFYISALLSIFSLRTSCSISFFLQSSGFSMCSKFSNVVVQQLVMAALSPTLSLFKLNCYLLASGHKDFLLLLTKISLFLRNSFKKVGQNGVVENGMSSSLSATLSTKSSSSPSISSSHRDCDSTTCSSGTKFRACQSADAPSKCIRCITLSAPEWQIYGVALLFCMTCTWIFFIMKMSFAELFWFMAIVRMFRRLRGFCSWFYLIMCLNASISQRFFLASLIYFFLIVSWVSYLPARQVSLISQNSSILSLSFLSFSRSPSQYLNGFEEVGDHALHERDQNNHNADVYAHEKDGDFAEAVVPFRVVEDDGRPASLYHNLHDHKMSLDQVPERTVFIVNVVRALLCNPESVVEPLHPDYAENVETRHEQREQPQTHKSADVKLVEQQSQPLVQGAQVDVLSEKLIFPQQLYNTVYAEQADQSGNLSYSNADVLIIAQQNKGYNQQANIQPIPLVSGKFLRSLSHKPNEQLECIKSQQNNLKCFVSWHGLEERYHNYYEVDDDDCDDYNIEYFRFGNFLEIPIFPHPPPDPNEGLPIVKSRGQHIIILLHELTQFHEIGDELHQLKSYDNGVVIGIEFIAELLNVVHHPQLVLIDVEHELMEGLRFYGQILFSKGHKTEQQRILLFDFIDQYHFTP